MISLYIPSNDQIRDFLKKQEILPFTYHEIGKTSIQTRIQSYDNDYLKVKIGTGEEDFQKAIAAIQDWRMFPRKWTRILLEEMPVLEGACVAMFAHFAGIWWRNACRIVYVINEPKRYGFAYGTLPAHIESGEELFLVSKDEKGIVWYEIRAFSRPKHWIAKVSYPIIRLLQAQFRRDSARQMEKILKNN